MKPLVSWADVKAPKKPDGPKERFEALRNEPLRVYVRSLPCLLRTELCRGATEPCHVRSKGAAGGDDDNLVPLCQAHHEQQHRLGIRTFEYRYRHLLHWKLKPIARKITSAWLTAQKRRGA